MVIGLWFRYKPKSCHAIGELNNIDFIAHLNQLHRKAAAQLYGLLSIDGVSIVLMRRDGLLKLLALLPLFGNYQGRCHSLVRCGRARALQAHPSTDIYLRRESAFLRHAAW